MTLPHSIRQRGQRSRQRVRQRMRQRRGSEGPVRRALTRLDFMARRAGQLSNEVLDVDELISAGHLAITQALASHDPRLAPLAPYLSMHLRWALAGEARRQLRRSSRRPSAPAGQNPPTPEQVLVSRRKLHALHEAVAQLPTEEQRVVTDHYFAGKSMRELARDQRMSKSTAWRRHQSAVRRLRRQLGELGATATRFWEASR